MYMSWVQEETIFELVSLVGGWMMRIVANEKDDKHQIFSLFMRIKLRTLII